MELPDLVPGEFLVRENRFVGKALIDGGDRRIHVADPGRLTELLYPGNSILVKKAPEGSPRKTRWSLMAARGTEGWVLLNTFLHRRLAEAILHNPVISPFGPLKSFRAEVTPRGLKSRFDFLLEHGEGEKTWLEVKGCSLKKCDRALFPDAPTTRGTRHLKELTELAEKGKKCAVMFLVFPSGVECFAPNSAMDPDFSNAFRKAMEAGVDIWAVQLRFDGRVVEWLGYLPVCKGY